MDPITIFVGLLVDAVRPTAQQAVADAYVALKERLIARYGERLAAPIRELEVDPASPQRRKQLADAMRTAGVDHNPDVTALLADLAYLVENLELQPGAADRVTRAKRRAGAQALHTVMDDHLANVLRAHAGNSVEANALLTTNLETSGLPAEVRAELSVLHGQMRTLIGVIADRVEADAYRQAEAALQSADHGLIERERAEALIRADRTLHTSYQTLQLTVGYLRECNEHLLQRIESSASTQQESKLMLGNAVLIYEVTDFVIRFIRDFTPLGSEQIRRIWEDRRAQLKTYRAQEEELRERVLVTDMPEDVREATLSQINDRIDSLTEVEREWRIYMDETNSLGGMVDDVRRQIGMLEIIRDNAERQIATLQEVQFLRFLKQNTMTIKRTADSLAQFRLAPLTPSRVRRLLQV